MDKIKDAIKKYKEEKVINLDDFKPKRSFPVQMKPVIQRPLVKEVCIHDKNLVIVHAERIVCCEACGAVLDPHWCLEQYAMEGGAITKTLHIMNQDIEKKEQELARLEKLIAEKKKEVGE